MIDNKLSWGHILSTESYVLITPERDGSILVYMIIIVTAAYKVVYLYKSQKYYRKNWLT